MSLLPDNPPIRRSNVAALWDPIRGLITPATLISQGNQIIAAGTPSAIGPENPEHETETHPEKILLPALVNAHTHLDLTHLGPGKPTSDFVAWIREIKDARKTAPVEIRASVNLGIHASLRGGVAIVGDISGAGSLEPLHTLRDSPLIGTSFLEVFGMGPRQSIAIDQLQSAAENIPALENGVQLGLQPHAPYTCGEDVYRAAANLNLPAATHLAESRPEIDFCHSSSGPLAHWLSQLGVWDPDYDSLAQHPLPGLADCFRRKPWLLVHLNVIEEQHLEKLAQWPGSVVYCPRASAFFGHPHPGEAPHRYRDMLNAGINVALGTDSIINLDTPDRISTFDEMKFLFHRDQIDPQTLLQMATINGARALNLDEELVQFTPGEVAGVWSARINLAKKPLETNQILTETHEFKWHIPPKGIETSASKALPDTPV